MKCLKQADTLIIKVSLFSFLILGLTPQMSNAESSTGSTLVVPQPVTSKIIKCDYAPMPPNRIVSVDVLEITREYIYTPVSPSGYYDCAMSWKRSNADVQCPSHHPIVVGFTTWDITGSGNPTYRCNLRCAKVQITLPPIVCNWV